MFAQNFHLVKDINTNTDSNPANPTNNIGHLNAKDLFAVLNGVSYFAADDGINGTGLWRSDGTAAGTYQLKAAINPFNITVANGLLFFIGNGTTGLWKSDGTKEGTIPVLNAAPADLPAFVPEILTAVNKEVFFAITNATTQLWKSDGTAAGTVLVKDFGSGADAYFGLNNFSAIKNRLYFAAFTSGEGYTSRLWITDGSANGTYIVSNKIAAPAQIIAATANPADSLVYFTGAEEEFGDRFIYITKGREGVASIAPGFSAMLPAFSFYTADILNIDGAIYFSGKAGANFQNTGLYKYSSTSGTQLIKGFTSNAGDGSISYVQDLAAVNGQLFFSFFDAPGKKNQLWKTDGTADGNLLLKDDFRGYSFTSADGQSYFWGTDGGLWKTDGKTISIAVAKAINFSVGIFSPGKLNALNGKFLYANAESTHGNELWLTDKTQAGTALLKDMNLASTASSDPEGMLPYNRKLFFAAKNDNSFNSLLLFKSDGTDTGTTLISDSIYGYYFRNFQSFGSQVYFWGTTKSGRKGIFKTDGTAGGTLFIKDFTNNALSVNGIKATANLVYFYLYNSAAKVCELWRTDGTAANTFVVKNNFPLLFEIEKAVAAGNKLYFILDNNLWATDGTVGGTQLIKNNVPASTEMGENNGLLYFSASNGSKNILWKSDGTPNGTVILSNRILDAGNFISANGSLFFLSINSDDNKGRELYKTDGTDAGTVLVKDINPGGENTVTFMPTNVNGSVYFFTQRSATGYEIELWKTNGSESSTQLISKVGNCSCNFPTSQVACNGRLFFVINNTLWQSDGTEPGTTLTQDDLFSGLNSNSNLSSLTASGNQLFFCASSYKYGTELYAGSIAAITFISAANGDWNSPATWLSNSVPPPGASIIVRHNVTGNINAVCNSLTVEKPGSLRVNTGVNITVLRQ